MENNPEPLQAQGGGQLRAPGFPRSVLSGSLGSLREPLAWTTQGFPQYWEQILGNKLVCRSSSSHILVQEMGWSLFCFFFFLGGGGVGLLGQRGPKCVGFPFGSPVMSTNMECPQKKTPPILKGSIKPTGPTHPCRANHASASPRRTYYSP